MREYKACKLRVLIVKSFWVSEPSSLSYGLCDLEVSFAPVPLSTPKE